MFPGESGVDQLARQPRHGAATLRGVARRRGRLVRRLRRASDAKVEIIKVLGTPTREELMAMNPNYTELVPQGEGTVCSSGGQKARGLCCVEAVYIWCGLCTLARPDPKAPRQE